MEHWSADQYSKFLKERTFPSLDLAAKINHPNPKKILDIGCGPGNSTKVLKDAFPNAEVFGADLSEDMLKTAKKNFPDLNFFKFDATSDFSTLSADYDIVFSNACIQWLPDHYKLIANMFGILAPGGILAVQIPMNQNEPIHVALETLGRSEKWFPKIGINHVFNIQSQRTYFDILAGLTDDFTVWETTYCHRVPSHDSILEWYKGTGLRPYLEKLSEKDGETFCNELLGRIKLEYLPQQNGEILLKFPRFFFTAKKSI